MSKIQVELGMEETVQYHRYLEMDQVDFDRLNAALDSQDRVVRKRAEEELRSRIDPYRDLLDADDLEVTDFRVRDAASLPQEKKP